MKKGIYYLLLLFIVMSVKASDENSKQNVIYVKSVNFALPLVKQWVSEYAKINPNVCIVVADKDADSKEIYIQLSISDTLNLDTKTLRQQKEQVETLLFTYN
jgi:hypothetical protein